MGGSADATVWLIATPVQSFPCCGGIHLHDTSVWRWAWPPCRSYHWRWLHSILTSILISPPSSYHHDLTIKGDRLLPRLLLPGQLVRLHLLPGSLATQATDCERGKLLTGWIQSSLQWEKKPRSWALLRCWDRNPRPSRYQDGVGMGRQGEQFQMLI